MEEGREIVPVLRWKRRRTSDLCEEKVEGVGVEDLYLDASLINGERKSRIGDGRG